MSKMTRLEYKALLKLILDLLKKNSKEDAIKKIEALLQE